MVEPLTGLGLAAEAATVEAVVAAAVGAAEAEKAKKLAHFTVDREYWTSWSG
jgi:hypothetical protein